MTSRSDRSVGRQVIARLDTHSTLPCGDKQSGKLSGKTTTSFDQIDDAKIQAYELYLIECFGFSASAWYSTESFRDGPKRIHSTYNSVLYCIISPSLKSVYKG